MPREMRKLFQYQSAGEPIPGSPEPAIYGEKKHISKPPETKRSERRRTWDNITKGQLAETLGNISHELRTPLAAMKVTLKVVLDGETGPVNSDQVRFLGMTMRNIDRLDRLVGELLEISQDEAALPAIQGENLDLRQIFEDVAVAHGPEARQSGIMLQVRPPRAGFRVWADADKLMQIISNVLSNALKYTPRGGLVQMHLEDEESGAGDGNFVLIIKDTGRGMRPDQVHNVFEAYVRCQDEGAADIPGTGLGLHITKGLVTAHGGKINIGSAPGVGTEVRITMPIKAPQ